MTETVGQRFGEIAVREGFASRSAVEECLGIQEKLRSFGVEPKRLGEIMVEKKYLVDADVDEILDMQAKGAAGDPARSGARSGVRSGEPKTVEDEFVPPEQLAGYEILEKLGQGGMGAVFKARQTSLDRTVAIKILPPRAARNRSFIQRFISEARTVAKLNHKNIIAGIDVGDQDGLYYFVMEYVEGESLDHIIEREGVIEESRALDIMTQMARALEHAARHGLVHRDVKPQNILVTPGGQAKLCDLGLARTMDELGGSQAGSGETRGTLLGTPHYLSPEQAKGERDLDIRSDLYSLGASFYHMLTGHTPFEGGSPMVLMTKHLTEDPESPRRLNPDVSKAASELCLALMEKDKEDRPQSPKELLEELERVRSGKKPRVGSRGSRRARKAERISRGSGAKPRRRRTPGGAGPPAHDEARRRRRAATIRSVQRNESTFLLIFIFTSILLGLVFVYMVFVRESAVKVPPRATQAAEEEASGRLIEATRAYRSGNRDEARGLFRGIVDNYPGTNAAETAKGYLSEMR